MLIKPGQSEQLSLHTDTFRPRSMFFHFSIISEKRMPLRFGLFILGLKLFFF